MGGTNMSLLKYRIPMAFAVALTLLAAAPADAQTVTRADIERLEVLSNEVSLDVEDALRRNNSLGNTEFEMLREEVIYLKVKQRKNERITRAQYNDVRSRLLSLQSRARAVASGVTGGVAGTSGRSGVYRDRVGRMAGEVPSGTEIDVRLSQPLSSETATVEQRFEAVTAADVYEDNRVLIPAGSRVRGVVSSVDSASRTDRRGSMTLAFDQITINGRTHEMRGTLTEVLQADKDNEVAKIGGGAGVGAIIGGIIGGLKGAIIGAVIGAGGTIAATEGSDVKLEEGTILRLKLDQPLRVGR
jgi:outer membrane lipoprotein SlyB